MNRAVLAGRNRLYLMSRLRAVVGRYGVTKEKAERRVRRCLAALEPLGLHPTFAAPGVLLDEDAPFFREIAAAGAELTVHGYNHVDFRTLSPGEAGRELDAALDAYRRNGIPCEGFRCPYLSITPTVRAAARAVPLAYSSNRAISWPIADGNGSSSVYAQLASFYRAESAEEVVSVPRVEDRLVEIPVTVPDDLQLWDALALGQNGLRDAWLRGLEQIHARGELFAPLFHPESFDLLAPCVVELLQAAHACTPRMWLAQLRDVARWWREREAFAAQVIEAGPSAHVAISASPRATVLVRDWPGPERTRRWDGRWSVLDARSVRIDDGPLPVVGGAELDAGTVAFLVEQGYVVDTAGDPRRCTVALDAAHATRLGTEVAILRHVEASSGPLLKFSRWPDEAKGALCLAGDLDALSLRDYARRLWETTA